MRRFLASLFALLSLPAFAQVVPISGIIVNQNGNPVPNAPIRVCSATSTGAICTPTVPIYLDYGLTIPLSNPTQADQYGNFSFYVGPLPSPNVYLVQVIPQSGITYSYLYPGAQTSSGGGGLPLTGGTLTGPLFGTTAGFSGNISSGANLSSVTQTVTPVFATRTNQNLFAFFQGQQINSSFLGGGVNSVSEKTSNEPVANTSSVWDLGQFYGIGVTVSAFGNGDKVGIDCDIHGFGGGPNMLGDEGHECGRLIVAEQGITYTATLTATPTSLPDGSQILATTPTAIGGQSTAGMQGDGRLLIRLNAADTTGYASFIGNVNGFPEVTCIGCDWVSANGVSSQATVLAAVGNPGNVNTFPQSNVTISIGSWSNGAPSVGSKIQIAGYDVDWGTVTGTGSGTVQVATVYQGIPAGATVSWGGMASGFAWEAYADQVCSAPIGTCSGLNQIAIPVDSSLPTGSIIRHAHAVMASAYSLATITSASGGTLSGTGTCIMALGNGSATATIASGSWSGATFAVTNIGFGFTGAPTSATLSNGTASCSGTATVTTTVVPAAQIFYGYNNLPGTGGGYAGRAYTQMGSGGTIACTVTSGAISSCTVSGGQNYGGKSNPAQITFSGITFTTAPIVVAWGFGALTNYQIVNPGIGIAGTLTATVTPTNGQAVYPSSKIYNVVNTANTTCTPQPNCQVDGTLRVETNANFTIFDTLESPHQTPRVSGSTEGSGQYLPNQASENHAGHSYYMGGINQNSDFMTTYQNGTGVNAYLGTPNCTFWVIGDCLLIPPEGHQLRGTFSFFGNMDAPPQGPGQYGFLGAGALIVQCGNYGIPCSSWTGGYNFLLGNSAIGATGSQDCWKYFPPTGNWLLTSGNNYWNCSGSGASYLFTPTGATWSQPLSITAAIPSFGDASTRVATDQWVQGVVASSGVASVTNSDASLIISPTTGAVVASINLGHSNVFTADQTVSTTDKTPQTFISSYTGGTFAQWQNTSSGGKNWSWFDGGSAYNVGCFGAHDDTDGAIPLLLCQTTATVNVALTAASLAVQSSRKGTFVCTGGGTIAISNTNELVTSDVVISLNTAGGTITTPPAMKTATGGTGFSVLCGATDTSTYNYSILN